MDTSKKLYRDMDNKMLAGVCSGLADYFHMDVTIVRLLTVVLALLTGGSVILGYIIAALVIPVKPVTPEKK